MSNTSVRTTLSIQQESNSSCIALRMFAMLVFLVTCCGGVFGQNQILESAESINTIESPSTDVSAPGNSSSTMELLLWFMGNKQIAPDKGQFNSEAATGKKVFINLGMTPNRILSKSLMKKALNFDQTLA